MTNPPKTMPRKTRRSSNLCKNRFVSFIQFSITGGETPPIQGWFPMEIGIYYLISPRQTVAEITFIMLLCTVMTPISITETRRVAATRRVILVIMRMEWIPVNLGIAFNSYACCCSDSYFFPFCARFSKSFNLPFSDCPTICLVQKSCVRLTNRTHHKKEFYE